MMTSRCRVTPLLVMLVTLSVTILSSPGAESSKIRQDLDWWKKTIVYQIYPRSFQDSDGDGVGDLKGIISRLDHLLYLNVGAIWLSPFYSSPMIDHGYDISDFTDVDPVFGTLEDFDLLIAEAHERGIYVIVDYIPNHSSDKHRWFTESRKGGDNNPYSDYYIWSDGKLLENGTRAPPNNWVSFFAPSAWTWDEVRGQYYLHQFAKEQPDLNYRNPKVVEEMLSVFQFWLDRGVDGFRVDAIGTMFEVEDLSLDEPRSFLPDIEVYDQFYYDHIYTRDQPEIHDVVKRWRQLFNEHDRRVGGHTFMVTEVFTSPDETIKYYYNGADLPFNLWFVFKNISNCDGICFRALIKDWLDTVPERKWPNFVVGNHDKNRISYRKGSQYVDAMNALLLTLPGTPTSYYGEEIGMRDIEVEYEDAQDPQAINIGPELYRTVNRDPCRSPMQWSDVAFAGFSPASTKKTWLPVHPEYRERNVKVQMSQPGSSLHIYRRLAEIRQRREFQTSQLTFSVVNSNVLSYLRYVEGCSTSNVYLVAINVGGAKSTDDYKLEVNGRTYDKAVIVLDTESHERADSVTSLNQLSLNVGQAVVLKLFNSDEVKAKDEL